MSELEKSVSPILAAHKLLGLFPVTSTFNLDVGLVVTNFLLMQIVLVGSLGLKFKIVFIDKVGMWSSLAEFAAVAVVSSTCILWVTHSRRHISTYMNDCRKTHDRFASLQFRPKYPQKKNLAQIQIFVLLTLPLVVSDVFIYDYDMTREAYLVVYNLGDAVSFLEILLFAHLVAVSKAHLNLINRFLKAKKVNVLWGKEREVFGELTKIFHEVHGSCKNLNAAFSVPLLSLTTMAFVCMLVDAFHAFTFLTDSLRHAEVELPVLKFVSRVFWVAYQIYKMYLLVEACDSLQDECGLFLLQEWNQVILKGFLIVVQSMPEPGELCSNFQLNINNMWNVAMISALNAKNFSVELREILATADPAQIIETEDLIRTHHLLYKKVDFTAADFYDVDFSLILSIVAAVGSYLVILIQFGSSKTAPTVDSTTSLPIANSSLPDVLNSTSPIARR